jgi:eukaryotic-like serine/threonine-protein kinase
MFRFITSKPLWVNILAGIFLALAILVLGILSLGWLTNHNNSRTVPSVMGKTFPEAQAILEKAGFAVEIQDSIYIDSLKPLQVTRQIPDEGELVKRSRTVYLTINRAAPPIVEMPNIVGYSLRSAEMVLANVGLKLGDTTFKPDFAKNSVLQQLYNGVIIQPGAKIRVGSKISLVIGDGLGDAVVAIPNLIGMTYMEAKTLLEGKGVGFASVIAYPDVKDTANAYIYRQNPERFDEEGHLRTIRAGQLIDIWLSAEKPEMHTPAIGAYSKDSTSANANQ